MLPLVLGILGSGHPTSIVCMAIRFDSTDSWWVRLVSRAGLMAGAYSIRNGVTHTIYERERLRLEQ